MSDTNANSKITIERDGVILTLQCTDNNAQELVDMFRAAMLAVGFHHETADDIIPDPGP